MLSSIDQFREQIAGFDQRIYTLYLNARSLPASRDIGLVENPLAIDTLEHCDGTLTVAYFARTIPEIELPEIAL